LKSKTKTLRKPALTEDQQKLLGGLSVSLLRNLDSLDAETFIKMAQRLSQSFNRELSSEYFQWWIEQCEQLKYVQKISKETGGYDFDTWRVEGVVR
jgi:hypothetical protein